MQAQTTEEARNFYGLGLPACTGNDSARPISFYTDDLFYADPSIRRGDERAGSMESAGEDLNNRSEPEISCVALRSHRPRKHRAVYQ